MWQEQTLNSLPSASYCVRPGGLTMKVAYGRVSTSSGEQASALVVQMAWLREQGPDLLLSDVESGLNTERQNYLELKRLIEAQRVSTVIATSLSRLGRDSTESDAFIRLCDRVGVQVETRDDGRLSMATAETLLLTRLKGSLNEGESLRLQQRVLAGLKAGRALGKPMRKPCWPYLLAADKTKLVLDPLEGVKARKFIDLLIAKRWVMNQAMREFGEEIPLNSSRSVRAWIMNPTLRGGIGYQQKPNHVYEEIIWERHEPILGHAEYADFRIVMERNKKVWGHNYGTISRALTSLCVCDECGRKMSYVPDRVHAAMRCRGEKCSQFYKSTREDLIIKWTVPRIREKAAEYLAASIENKESPELLELRRQVESLEQLNDPDLESVIERKKERVKQLESVPADHALVQEISDPAWWDQLDYRGLIAVFQQTVREIRITRQAPTALRLKL